MHEPLIHALRDWQSFYTLTGTAAATLGGLLFIAMQFGADVRYPSGPLSAVRTWILPVLIFFVDVLAIAALTLIPTQTHVTLGALLLVAGSVNVISVLDVIRRSLREYSRDELHGTHWLWNVALPLLAHALLLISAIALLANQGWSLNTLAAADLSLLLIGFINAWLVMLWIAQRRSMGQVEDTAQEAVSTSR